MTSFDWIQSGTQNVPILYLKEFRDRIAKTNKNITIYEIFMFISDINIVRFTICVQQK